MKKVSIYTCLGLAAVMFAGCGSTESISTEDKDTSETISAPVVEEIKITQEQIYAESISSILISQVSVPKNTIKGTAFSAPFVAKITDSEGNPLPSYEVSVSIPVSRNDGIIQFDKENIISAEDGTITITSGKPAIACKSEISISPAVPEDLDSEDETLKAAVEAKTLKLPYIVKSDIINKGTVLFVYDFNERNNPTQNSSTILSEIKKRGVWRIGNAPVSDKSYIGKPLKNLYEANYEIIEDEFGYLLYGTVKFETPVTEVEDGYSCTLKVDLVGIEMKKGKQVFSTTVTHSAVGANWNKCVSKCKDEIAVKVVDELMFGL